MTLELRMLLYSAVLGIANLVASRAVAKEWPPTYFVTPCKCRGSHGEDRWKAKTDRALVPADARQIRALKPSDVYAWQPLDGLNEDSKRKAPEEAQWIRVTGRVVEVKAEADGDIHFALEDAKGRRKGRILAEVPIGSHWCDLRRSVFAWTTKGWLFPEFQDASRNIGKSHPIVTVTGKAFFDWHHAAKHPLANRSIIDKTGGLAAWEIHPVAQIDETVEVRRALPVARARRG